MFLSSYVSDITYKGQEIEEIEVTVEFSHTSEERGSRGSYGEQLTPDYPAEIEIEEIIAVINGIEVDIKDVVCDRDKERIENEAFEEATAEPEDFAASMA